MKIALVAGARPNFMKVAPLCHELSRRDIPHYLVNAGQHFSTSMAADFFNEFEIQPDYSLEPRRDSVAVQFADMLVGLERTFLEDVPTMVVVVGDVNATLAGALAANKLGIPVAHVEAGLRSYNRAMPEEHNRVLTDHLADLLLVTTEEGVTNLAQEGITKGVHHVGNIMIDTLVRFLPRVKDTDEQFFFATLHRAENIDDKAVFTELLDALEEIAKDAPIYLPLHPRTKKMAEHYGLTQRLESVFRLLEPQSYTDSLFYQKNAQLVLTDSGGLQEETSYLGTPCITLRTETERPITVDKGTNVLGGVTKNAILSAYREHSRERHDTNIPLWDGKTAKRIVDTLIMHIQ